MPVTLYQGDCLRVLPSLPEKSIDAVLNRSSITFSNYHVAAVPA
jgi:hypothetical protein